MLLAAGSQAHPPVEKGQDGGQNSLEDPPHRQAPQATGGADPAPAQVKVRRCQVSAEEVRKLTRAHQPGSSLGDHRLPGLPTAVVPGAPALHRKVPEELHLEDAGHAVRVDDACLLRVLHEEIGTCSLT